MISVNAVCLNDTPYCTISEEDKTYIREVWSVYAYNPHSSVHLCELTPSYDLRYLYSYIVWQGDPLNEDIRDNLHEKYCSYGDDTYIHCSDVKRHPVKECGQFEDMEAACEYLQGNCPF